MSGIKELYANENATVKCPALNGSMTVSEICNRSVKADGKLLLTAKGAKVTGNGNCKILTSIAGGIPQLCMCKLSSTLTGWQMVSKNTANNSPLLLEKKSINQCTVGSTITINDAGQSKVTKDTPTSISPLPLLVMTTIAPLKQEKQTTHETINLQDENKNPVQGPDDKAPEVYRQNDSFNNESVTKEFPERKIPFLPRTGMLCPCSETNPEQKCNDCAYRLDRRTSPKVANNSRTLRTNYESARARHDKYDKYFDELFGLFKENDDKQNALGIKRGWSTVAHHIIPGKQVLEEFPLLVKLARFCGYDVDNNPESTHGINHYPNCIMLVGYPSDYGKLKDDAKTIGKKEQDFAKSSNADEVMRESRIHWHVGSHQYRFAKDEKKKLRKKSKENQEYNAAGDVFRNNMQILLGKRLEFRGQDLTIACYADLVKARLLEFENELKANPVCYKENENYRQEFIRRMEEISGEIKKKLAAFYEKPHRSYPYFVSLEAYLYAFAVPRTVHAVLIRSCNQGLYLTPWRITRYTNTLQDNNKSLSFEKSGEGVYLHEFKPDKRSDEEVLKCLRSVCQKSRYFLLADDLMPQALPFLIDAEKDPKNGTAYFFRIRAKGKSDEIILQENDSDIATWLRSVAKNLSQRDDLQGDMGVLKIRLREWKKLTREGK